MNKLQETIKLGTQPHEHRASGSHKRLVGSLAQIARFVGHLMEMIIAMAVGMMAWGAVSGVFPESLGFNTLLNTFPELDYGLMALFMSVPMVMVMRWRKHGWKQSWEMVAAMAAPTAAVVICWRLGAGAYIPLFSDQTLPMSTHLAMILGMFVLMLYRRHEFLHASSHMSVAPAQL